MKIFRTAFLIPLLIILTLIFVFIIFYLDVYLKKVFISAGESVFGAKVEIANVKTSFKNFTVNVNVLKIGDKDEEFKNLVDIDNINFKVRFIPLLSKKVIIDNMSVEGIKWATARKTSAKLPPKKQKKEKDDGKPSFAQKAMSQLKEQSVKEFNSFPSVAEFNKIQAQIKDFSPQSVIDMTGIQSVSKVQNYYVELTGKYDSYAKSINDHDVKKLVEEVSALADKISKISVKTPADIKILAKTLSEIKDEKKRLEETYGELKNIKDSLLKDAKGSKNAFKDINSVISGDVDNISSKLSIPSLDFKNVSRMLFGGLWVSRADKVFHYLNIIRKYMPEKSKEEKKSLQEKERIKGRDISYPLKSVLPSILIVNVSISGTSGGEGKTGVPVSFKGRAGNISTDQNYMGKPAAFDIEGSDPLQTMKVSGSFDRLTDTAKDTISFEIDGINAKRLGIPQTDYTPSFDNAKASFSADFSLAGSDFISNVGIKITSVTYNAENKNFDDIDKKISKHLVSLWEGINSVNVKAGISITQNSGESFSFSSDIDKLLSAKFSAILNSAVGDVKVKIRQEVTHYVESQKKVLQGESDKYAANLQKELDLKLSELAKQNNVLKKLIEKKEKELKLSSVSSLSSLFPPK
ncbi:MAG: TIGR03545 family protein [Endomicrobium sp.]|jgi:uncharacterized protein (TIGR03545 family)|nr:TIGR03545 family protein [Endomicrobium sp.]